MGIKALTKNPFLAIWHVIFSLVALGYGMEYYFHLSKLRHA